MNYRKKQAEDKSHFLEVDIAGSSLLSHSFLNKEMAFTEKERTELCLHGLIPPHIATIEEQCVRSYNAFLNKKTALGKYTYLRDLQNSNETLFYHLIQTHIEEMLPVIYTPTVGEGCTHFSHIYRRSRGVFLSYPYHKQIKEILANPQFDPVKVIVVSDGERVLGLGDQGVGGMGIAIGKLSLYTAGAGIHPDATLPILLDTGTDNEALLQDPLYIGWRHKRIRGKEYDAFVDSFVSAIKERFPSAILQWEDFSKLNAEPLLERYQDFLCSFNDDIQGTAAIVLSSILSALHIKKTKITEEKVIIVGAGSAGCGIAKLLLVLMMQQGLSCEEAKKQIFLIDRQGLLTEDSCHLSSNQRFFAQKNAQFTGLSLEEAVLLIKPSILIGVSGQKGIFTKKIVQEMAKEEKNPMIFPLSNPTSCCEAIPSDLLQWTSGRAIIGTGSPFPDTNQINNVYIFPGVGLGAIACQANKISDAMFVAAAKALADISPAKENPKGALLPPLTKLREVSFHVAKHVAKEAIESKIAPFKSSIELEKALLELLWEPTYLPYFLKT
jgi:malate dehydrogenase (oxaloacetate-decarboxylating)